MAAAPEGFLPRTDSGASTDTATWAAAGEPSSGQQEAAYGTWDQQTQLQVDIDATLDDILADLLHVEDIQPVAEHLPLSRAPSPPIITAEDVLQHTQFCSSCQLLRAEGEELHGSIVTMQGGARLRTLQAQQTVEVLVKATTACQKASSSSSSGSACSDMAGSSSSPCLLMDTEQLSQSSLWSWGAWYAKARMAPQGQKRAANGTSLPWNFNFGTNAPLLLPQPAHVWDLLLANDSSTSDVQLPGNAAETAGQTSMPDLYCIRSRSKQLVAVALACHNSSSSSSDASPPCTSAATLARLFPTPIVCNKKGNRLHGQSLMLYPFVVVFRDEAKAAAGAVDQKKPRIQL